MRVNVDSKAIADPRFMRLGMALKKRINRYEALGRCVVVWTMAYENRSEIMAGEDVDAVAELEGFAAAMLKAGLASKHGRAGKLRLAGVAERVEWLVEQDRKRTLAAQARRQASDEKTSRGKSRGKSPGTFPRDVPTTLTPTPTPDLDPESGVSQSGEPPPPDGWSPPVGGPAAEVLEQIEREFGAEAAAQDLSEFRASAATVAGTERAIRNMDAAARARFTGALKYRQKHARKRVPEAPASRKPVRIETTAPRPQRDPRIPARLDQVPSGRWATGNVGGANGWCVFVGDRFERIADAAIDSPREAQMAMNEVLKALQAKRERYIAGVRVVLLDSEHQHEGAA